MQDDAMRTSLLIERARQSERQSNWKEALDVWQTVRKDSPDEVQAHLHAARMLWQLRRFEEADAILVPALGFFPEHPEIVLEYARVAHVRADWPEALRRWEIVLQQDPSSADASTGACVALTHLGRLDEADELLGPVMAKFQHNSNIAISYARIAHVREDWPEALRRWKLVQDHFGDRFEGPIGVNHALRRMSRFEEANTARLEADAVLSNMVSKSPTQFQPAMQYAQAAEGYGNWLDALSRWQALKSRFPERPEGHSGVGATLLRLKRYDEADEELAAATRRFPGNILIATDYASAAHHRGDFLEAARRWQALIERFDGPLTGFTGRALALRQNDNVSEAEGLLRDAISRFPESRVLIDYWKLEKQFRRFNETDVDHYLVDRAMAKIYTPFGSIHTEQTRNGLHDHVGRFIGHGTALRYLEFGVASGFSFRGFLKRFTNPESRFTGFDSFEGLPESWLIFPTGAFSTRGRAPDIDDDRADFVKGWFQNTLPDELQRFVDDERVVLVHFDADLYSATLFLLTTLWHAFSEYYFIMDEFPGDEVRALYDFSLAYPVSIELLAQTHGVRPTHVFGKIARTELVITSAV